MTSKELEQLARSAKNNRMRNCYLAIYNIVDGKSRTDIEKYLKTARNSVTIWIQKFIKEGINAIN